MGPITQVSGTVGATVEAASQGIPAIAFSGASGDQIAWDTSPLPLYVSIYADLAFNVTSTLLASGTPYLPKNTWLNVNFPEVSDVKCPEVAQFKFILTRIHQEVPFFSDDDVEVCGNGERLPEEGEVIKRRDGCWVSVSVGKVEKKLDAEAKEQGVVAEKLGGLLSCLPGEDD